MATKPDGKRTQRPRLSQASRVMGGALRATLQVPAEEPGRGKRPKDNQRAKKPR